MPAIIASAMCLGSALFWVLAALACLASRTHEQTRPMKRRSACCAVLAVLLTMLAALPFLGLAHGMTMEMATEMTWRDAVAAFPRTPSPDPVPDDPRGTLFVVYRYDCPACLRSYGMTRDVLDTAGIDPVYVSSRSDKGKAFVEAHRIASVPSAVYVSTSDPSLFFVEPIYPDNQFNQEGLDELVRKYLARK